MNKLYKYLVNQFFNNDKVSFEMTKEEIKAMYSETKDPESIVKKLEKYFPIKHNEERSDDANNFIEKSGYTVLQNEDSFKFTKNHCPTFEINKLRYNNKAKLSNQTIILKKMCKEKGLACLKETRTAKENILVALTKANSIEIEKMINADSYFPSSRYVYNYYAQIENIDFSNVNDSKTKRAYEHIIRLIDYENSTNAWRFNREAFKDIIKYITNPVNNFYNELQKGDTALPDKLKNSTGKNILSLCSKICKYMAEFLFTKEHDKYYIYDWYVAHVLPFYLDAYEIEFEIVINNNVYVDFKHKRNEKKYLTHGVMDHNSINYEQFHKLMSKLHKKLENTINKSQLDHIMWYCYKSYLK